MSLPNLPAGDKLRREVRTEWGGLNLNENSTHRPTHSLSLAPWIRTLWRVSG